MKAILFLAAIFSTSMFAQYGYLPKEMRENPRKYIPSHDIKRIQSYGKKNVSIIHNSKRKTKTSKNFTKIKEANHTLLMKSLPVKNEVFTPIGADEYIQTRKIPGLVCTTEKCQDSVNTKCEFTSDVNFKTLYNYLKNEMNLPQENYRKIEVAKNTLTCKKNFSYGSSNISYYCFLGTVESIGRHGI